MDWPEVFGGNVGGPISKDKLFFFLGGEYFKQDLVAPVVFNAPFTALDGSYHSPFRDTQLDGRLDYKLSTSRVRILLLSGFGSWKKVAEKHGMAIPKRADELNAIFA